MTTPDERTRAVLAAKDFIQDMMHSEEVPERFREIARRVLRHYPGVSELRLAHTALPMVFGAAPAESAGGTERRALGYITTDPETMSGIPCFIGSRVPITTVIASLDAGMTLDEVRQQYPFITEEHVHAARQFLESWFDEST